MFVEHHSQVAVGRVSPGGVGSGRRYIDDKDLLLMTKDLQGDIVTTKTTTSSSGKDVDTRRTHNMTPDKDVGYLEEDEIGSMVDVPLNSFSFPHTPPSSTSIPPPPSGVRDRMQQQQQQRPPRARRFDFSNEDLEEEDGKWKMDRFVNQGSSFPNGGVIDEEDEEDDVNHPDSPTPASPMDYLFCGIGGGENSEVLNMFESVQESFIGLLSCGGVDLKSSMKEDENDEGGNGSGGYSICGSAFGGSGDSSWW